MNRFLRDIKAPEANPRLAQAVKCARVEAIIDEAERRATATPNVWERSAIRENALRAIKAEIGRRA